MMSIFNPLTFEFEDNSESDNSDISYEILDIICNKCKSIMPTKSQLDSHITSCTGRTSFMRLSNNHPEFHPEEEVLWVITNYIDKQIKHGKYRVDMPIGSKYLEYSTSIKNRLKSNYNNIQFQLLYTTTNCLWIRAQW